MSSTGWSNWSPAEASFSCRESYVERSVVCHQHRISAAKAWKAGALHRLYTTSISAVIPWICADSGRDAGRDRRVRTTAAAQLAIDDARCADLYDLSVALEVETGFGIEDRKRQLGKQTVVERMPFSENREQIEVSIGRLAAQIGLGFCSPPLCWGAPLAAGFGRTPGVSSSRSSRFSPS